MLDEGGSRWVCSDALTSRTIICMRTDRDYYKPVRDAMQMVNLQ
jgi:hypothetical protein